MRKTKPSLMDIGISSRSKSKSESKDAIQKVYTSPPKCRKIPSHIPEHDKKRAKASSKAQGSEKNKNKSSTSKSNSKNKTIRDKMANSPYQSTKAQSKKKLFKIPDAGSSLKLELEKCRAKIQSNRYEQANKSLNKLLNRNPDHPEILYLLGSVAEMENRGEDAKKLYRDYLKITTKQQQQSKKTISTTVDLDKLQKLAKSNFFLSNFQNTIDYCTRILNSTKNEKIYQLKGKAQLARKKYGPAIDSFTNALALNKNNFQLYELQGDCYRGIQAFQLALNCYSKYASNFLSDSLRILQKKSQCFRLLGNKPKFDELLQKMEQLKTELVNEVKQIKIPFQKSQQSSASEKTQSINLGGLFPFLRSMTPSLASVQQFYKLGNFENSLNLVQKIIENQGENLKNLYWNALLLFQMEDYESCQMKINKYIQLLQNPINSLVSLFISDPQQASMLSSLKIISSKLKQLNAYALTQEQDKLIVERRKKCLKEALNVFKSKENPDMNIDSSLLSSKLTMIMEESSLQSSRFYDDEQSSSIFILRFIRKVIKNWYDNKFSLQSLEQTTDLAYSLVRIRYKQFSILPMHIIYYTLRPENYNKTFTKIDDEINSVLSRMSKKYPPSEADISQSQLRTFEIKWEKKEKVNILSTVYRGQPPRFNSYKQLHKAIEKIADVAQQQLYKMNEICKNICLGKNNGFGYKIGLKIDRSTVQIVQQRVLSRVIQKMLSKQIKEKRSNFFNDIQVKPNKKLEDYFADIEKQWEQTIQEIIRQKNQRNQEIKCYVYDFLRAKCMFNSVKQMRETTLQMIELHSKGQIYLLEINDRLSSKTKDVVLKFKVKDIVGELQLALEFQSIQNQFNHGLYELFRSPFGSFFASVMWFSGFALKKNQIFFKQKIKWSLNGLEYLRKFIYEDQISVSFTNQYQKLSLDLILTDFDISSGSLCTYLCTKTHLYLAYDQIQSTIVQKIQKPATKFIVKLTKGNFITNQQQKYEIHLRLEGTQIFLTLSQKNQLLPVSLQNSISAQTLTMKIKQGSKASQSANDFQGKDQKYYNYHEEIEECRTMQHKLIEMLNKMQAS